MKFNVNEYVRVKLTPTGKDILRKQFEERHERMPDVFKELSLPEEDEQGFSQWQMWRLFETFGNHVFLGCEPPFETEIEIVENAFQQSVHPTLGSLARFQAFFHASAFFQSDGVPPPAPARVTQTVRAKSRCIIKLERRYTT